MTRDRNPLRDTTSVPWWHDNGMLGQWLRALGYAYPHSADELIRCVEKAHRVRRADAQGLIDLYLEDADAA